MMIMNIYIAMKICMKEPNLKVENLRISDYSDANKDDIDMYLGNGIFEKDDLEPEELDDLLIPEEEWDDDE